MCYNTLWDPKRLQWYYSKTTENKMNGNTLQVKAINTGEFKYSESLMGLIRFVLEQVVKRQGVGLGWER
jgi:hypothetical protein